MRFAQTRNTAVLLAGDFSLIIGVKVAHNETIWIIAGAGALLMLPGRRIRVSFRSARPGGQ